MAAITAAAMRRRVKNMLYTAQPSFRPHETTLATASINASVTTMDVPTGTGGAWQAGDVAEFDDGEKVLVTAVSTDALTIIRGHEDTTAATHTQGDVITQNPRFSVAFLDQAIDDAVVDLYPEIYELHTFSDTYAKGTKWYPMDAAGDENIFDVLSVYYTQSGVSYPTAVSGWYFVNKVDATGYTEPNGLHIPGGVGSLADAGTFYVATKKAYTTITDIDAASPVIRIVAHYAVYKALGLAEAARTYDPGRRTDRTVQPGAEGRSSIWFLREAERLRLREEARLFGLLSRLPQDRISNRMRRFRR